MNSLKFLAILIPAHNEDQVIVNTVKHLKKVVHSTDIYIVDDFSTDNTVSLVSPLLPKGNVLQLTQNLGKLGALNHSIAHFKLTDRYQYIIPIDADTILDIDFIYQLKLFLKKNPDPNVVAIIGHVCGLDTNWLTRYRIWEYEVSQSIYKNAQSRLNIVSVCPGCATVYRSFLFKNHAYPSGTRTEDMDLRFYIHRHRLGRIAYCNKAKVYTQDPKNILEFIKQIDRWFTGFWQCLDKHNIPWGGQLFDFEVALLATEGLANSLVILLWIFSFPILLSNPIKFIGIPFLLDLLFFFIPSLLYTYYRTRLPKIFLSSPLFYPMRLVSGLVFLKAFFQVILAKNYSVGWSTKRYRFSNPLLWSKHSLS